MRLLPFTMILWVGILIVAGVVVTGGGITATFQEQLGIAQSAARAATNAATGRSVNGDAFDLNPTMAINAAQNYLVQAGATGETTVDGDTVTVTVTTTYTPVFLGPLADLAPVNIEATGTARLIGG